MGAGGRTGPDGADLEGGEANTASLSGAQPLCCRSPLTKGKGKLLSRLVGQKGSLGT